MVKCFYYTRKWFYWAYGGGSVLVLSLWIQVQLTVAINTWYGGFYDLLQNAEKYSDDPQSGISLFYEKLISIKYFTQSASIDQSTSAEPSFLVIAMPYVILATFTGWFTRIYGLRWRESITFDYIPRWRNVEVEIEGASQRIQEDCNRFARIVESLGLQAVRAIMTLIAFLPVLAALSVHVESMPIVGAIPYPLVVLSIAWAIFGTLLLLVAGIRLPGLEFKNQRVEAAFRKELVLGEDSETRGQPIKLSELFQNVRKNYFRIYIHYTYFNLFRYMYFQADNVIAYVFLIPTIVSGRITLGIMNQILRAFGQVASSFQFLVASWTSIIELISIYKRLQAFEATIDDQELPKIDQEFLERGMKED